MSIESMRVRWNEHRHARARSWARLAATAVLLACGAPAASAGASADASAAESVAAHIAQRDELHGGALVIEASAEHAPGLAVTAASLEFVAGPSLPPGATQALLRTDPATGGVERFIRFPAGLHITRHWHLSDETVVLLEGSVTVSLEHDVTAPPPPAPLEALAYTHIPARMIHEAWVGPEGALIYQRMSATPDRHAAPD